MVKVKAKNHYLETAKFGLRIALLILVPMVVGQLMELDGNWKILVENLMPILLPIIDRWIHLDPRIKARGLVPF